MQSNSAAFQKPPPSTDKPVIDPVLVEKQNYPGIYEDLHKKTKDVFPIVFEGFRFTLNKLLSAHFQINHSMSLSSVMPSTYKFGATYIGANQISQSEAYPILLGDMDSSGNLNANMIHQLNSKIKTRVVAQIHEQQLAALQVTNDYKGDKFSASLTAVNVDLIKNSGVLIGHYLHRVTQNLDVGTELVMQYGKSVPNGRMAFYSFGWRYFGKEWQLSGAINPLGALHLCYHHQSKSPIQFGVELEANLRTTEVLSTFGYQVDLNKANLTFKGMVDSNWTVGAVLEKRLLPLPFTLAFSGYLDHVKPSYKFGIGLTIG